MTFSFLKTALLRLLNVIRIPSLSIGPPHDAPPTRPRARLPSLLALVQGPLHRIRVCAHPIHGVRSSLPPSFIFTTDWTRIQMEGLHGREQGPRAVLSPYHRGLRGEVGGRGVVNKVSGQRRTNAQRSAR